MPGEVNGATNLPSVRLQVADQRGNEISGLDGIVTVSPPRTSAQLEFGGAVVILLLEELQVPLLVDAFTDDGHEIRGHVKQPQPIVTRKDQGTVSDVLHFQVRTPLERKFEQLLLSNTDYLSWLHTGPATLNWTFLTNTTSTFASILSNLIPYFNSPGWKQSF